MARLVLVHVSIRNLNWITVVRHLESKRTSSEKITFEEEIPTVAGGNSTLILMRNYPF